MKLRILDNSIRLRLRKSEVDQFAAQGFLEAATGFPGAPLVYRLEASPQHTALAASRTPAGGITVSVPETLARAWTSSAEVAIAGNDGQLSILIEKDFQRTSVRSLIDFDLYPNPRRHAG